MNELSLWPVLAHPQFSPPSMDYLEVRPKVESIY